MRKKVFSIVAFLFLLLTSVGLVACKKKSSNLQFKVYYAFNEESATWQDGTSGISCYYGEGEDHLNLDGNGFAKLYLKIDIENVPANNVDKIFVSSFFGNKVVSENEVFAIDVKDKKSDIITISEINSQKSKTVPINISKELEGIEANLSVKPAVVVGEQIDLSSYNETNGNSVLKFNPVDANGKTLTNQTAVTYLVTGVGYFDEVNHFNQVVATSPYIRITNSTLSVDGQFAPTSDRYAIRVLATSVDKPDYKTEFYVYVVPKQDFSPVVQYAGGFDLSGNAITLYHNSTYSMAALAIDPAAKGPYATSLNTADGKTQAVVNAFDASTGRQIAYGEPLSQYGLVFSRNGANHTIATTDPMPHELTVEFRTEIEGLDFGASAFSLASPKRITIRKANLPDGININGEPFTNNSTYSGTVYTVNGTQTELSLNLQIINAFAESQHIEIEDQTNSFKISPERVSPNERYVFNNDTIGVTFANATLTEGSFRLKFRSNPERFQGEEIEAQYTYVTISLVKRAACDGLEIYKDEGYTKPLTSANILDVGLGLGNKFYIRAYYEGNNFDASSVSLLSESSNIKFLIGSSEIDGLTLQDLTAKRTGEQRDGEFAGKSYTDYEISLANIRELEKSNIVIRAQGSNRTYNFVVAPRVYTNLDMAQFDVDIPVETEYATKIDDINNGHFNFAMAFNKTVNFAISGRDYLGNPAQVVSAISLRQNEITVDDEHFKDNAVDVTIALDKLSFSVRAKGVNATQIVQLAIDYYSNQNGYIELMTGENAAVITLEFAVFLPVDSVDLTLDIESGRNVLTYVDSSIYPSAKDFGKATISYQAKSELSSLPPSRSLVFTSNGGVANVPNPSKILVKLSNSLIGDTQINIDYGTGAQATEDGGAELSESFGTVVVNLTGTPQIDSLEFIFDPISFGKEIGAKKSVTLRFQACAVADDVIIGGGDLVAEGVDSQGQTINYINISYLKQNGDSGSVTKKFNASASYASAVANTFKLNELGTKLYKMTVVNGVSTFNEVQNNGIEVKYNNGTITITANKNSNNGGDYRLDIFALDSLRNGVYSALRSVNLRISDGQQMPFTISNAEEFALIQNNLDANFVLTADFTVEQSIAGTFTGSLTGLSTIFDSNGKVYTTNHTLTVVLKNKNIDEDTNYVGLFAVNDGRIENLNVSLKFDIDDVESASGNVLIGGIAGKNTGSILNVEVTLAGITTISFGKLQLADASLSFGLVAGQNVGTINLGSGFVSAPQLLTLNLTQPSTYNVGLIAGENIGSIVAAYGLNEGNAFHLGKESLTNVVYSVIGNLVVNSSAVSTINIGGVAGKNGSLISNILVGGRIVAQGTGSNANLGGIAGESGAANGDNKGIRTVAILGLDLNNKIGPVAGIAAKSENTEYYDVKVISTQVKFAGLTTLGTISGSGVVAGILANSTNDRLTYATNETFILKDTEGKDIYTLTSTAGTVAGLIYSATGTTIKASFVNANLGATGEGTIYLTSPKGTSETGTYFVGKVQAGSPTINSNTNYAVVYTDDIIKYAADGELKEFEEYTQTTTADLFEETDTFEADAVYTLEDGTYTLCSEENGGTYYKLKDATNIYTLDGTYQPVGDLNSFSTSTTYYTKADWQNFVTTTLLTKGVTWQENEASIDGLTDETFKFSSDENLITVGGTSFGLPYLVVNGEQLRVVSPKEVQAQFNRDYVIYTNSVLVESTDNNNEDFDISEIEFSQVVLVNYFEFENNNAAATEFNTHYLINRQREINGVLTNTGLLDLHLDGATDGGITFEVVSGSKAVITSDGQRIVFTGVSKDPIIVRAYSILNPSVECFVAFFTQYGESALNLTSTSSSLMRSSQPGYDYQMTIHTGMKGASATVSAENLFQAKKFKSIFSLDKNNFALNNLVVRASVESADGTSEAVLDAKVVNNTVQISFKDDAEFAIAQNEKVTISLYQNLTATYGAAYFPQLDGADALKLIDTTNLLVYVYKSTEKIEIENNAYQVDSEGHIKFDVKLITGYVNPEDTEGYLTIEQIEKRGDVVTLKEENKDSLILTFKGVENDVLTNLINATGVSGIAELFDYVISYKQEKEGTKIVGYIYSIELSLRAEFDYRYFKPTYDAETGRYTQENIQLDLTITSATNPYALDENLAPVVKLTFTPTQFQSARMYNYTITDFAKSATDIMKVNPIDTSTINPSATSYGSVMVIHLEPAYANVINATLTCQPVNVQGVGSVGLVYEQLVYNPNNNTYAALPISGGRVENGINLQLLSQYTVATDTQPAELIYDGTIYVHVMVDAERASGYTATLTSRLTANVLGSSEPIVREKQLTTEFLPGIELDYDRSAEKDGGYLIQEETINPVSIKLYGYQFNSMPDISFVWNLEGTIGTDGFYLSGYKYADGDRTTIIDRAGKEYKVNDYVEHSSLTDYDGLTANADGSYTYNFNVIVHKDIMAGFKLNADLSVVGKNEINNEHRELIFHPVKYIVKSVYVDNLNNGTLDTVMSATNRIDLKFITNNTTKDLSDEIYADLLKSMKSEESEGVENLAKAFVYTVGGQTYDFGTENNLLLVRYDSGRNCIYITGLAEFETSVQLYLGFGYSTYELNNETGLYEIKFVKTVAESPAYTFNLIVRSGTQEDAPISISSGEEFVEKLSDAAQNKDFILMNDIDLYDYSPIEANFASLDGNNKVIRIHQFAVSASRADYGLFASIGSFTPAGTSELKSTTLKNIIVDYGQFEGLKINKTDSISSAAFGGLVARVNAGGLIYNCDVMNLTSSTKDVHVVLSGFVDTEVDFGGLVGTNSGVITNSRVGRNGYYKISLDAVTEINESQIWQSARPINFVLGDPTASEGNVDANGFIGVAGAFAGRNEQGGVIASSYVANTGLKNYSTYSDEFNFTAGFVAENHGDIRYSYVKALEDTIKPTANSVRSTGMQIESAGNGNVAGFVYNNYGNISNSFANTVLRTDSALIAGFVYRNNDGATIEACYAACTMNAGSNHYSYAEQPFVGVDEKQQLLSYGTISNCYYLEEEGASYNTVDGQGRPNAAPMNVENFSKSTNLNGFEFINSDRRQESDLGVWTYYTMDTNQLHMLPELTSANQIAYSYRYIVNNDQNEFANAPSYQPGTKNNPYIIRTAQEFNKVLTNTNGSDVFTTRQKSKSGYLRLINDISFENVSLLTRADFTFGDKTNANNLTSLEGNGMTISNISLDVLEEAKEDANENGFEKLEKVGFFAEIYNAYIKNLNLEFEQAVHVDKNPTTPIKYSGGLAGTIDNSILINLNLTGENTTLAGKNFVGGIAGVISGKSKLYDISVNINVVSDSNTTSDIYYNLADFVTVKRNEGALSQSEINNTTILNERYNEYLSGLSYAGGVAGVLDLDASKTENLFNIVVNADRMGLRADGNIEAGFAGGIAGFAGRNVNALKLKFYVGDSTTIHGSQAAGGIFALGLGSITASQVSARENNDPSGQYTIDNNFANYVLALNDNPDATLTTIGNTKLLRSDGFAGGLIGIGIVPKIESCYAKSSLDLAKTFGGLIGLSVGATIFHSYAVPYVNLDNTLITNVGGLIGEATSILETSTTYLDYVHYANWLLGETRKYTDIAYTFSTILTDNQMLSRIIAGQVIDPSGNQIVRIEQKQIDYLAAVYQTNDTCHLHTNDIPITSGTTLDVYVGRVNNYRLLESENAIKYTYGDWFDLYKIYETDKSSQAELFNRVFSDWPTQYWLMDEQKYFPLLIKEDALNYIIIDEAKDFKILENNRNLNYKIVKDIDMSGYESSSNWIFNINFTGTLIGDLGEESTALPRVYNLNLTPTVNNNTAGLFRNTTGARIRNVDFVWTQTSNAAIDIAPNVNITTVGGLTCEDVGSTFINVNVYVGTYSSSNGQIISQNQTMLDGRSAISSFGGLVGSGENTTINDCSFNGNVTASLEGQEVYFGGLVGIGKKTGFSLNEFSTARFLVLDSFVGNVFSSKAEISLSAGTKNAYVGASFGYLEGAAVSGIGVGSQENNMLTVDLTVSANALNSYVGGLIGYADNTSITKVEVLTKLNATSEDVSGGTRLDMAGLAGRFGGTEAITDSTISTTIDVSRLSTTVLNVAGGIAEMNTAGIVNISETLFTGAIVGERDEQQNSIATVYAAGVVANLNSEGTVSLSEVVTNVDISVGTPQLVTTSGTETLYAGGFVGISEQGSVVTNNAVSAGKIVPVTATTAQKIYVGGFVGMAGSVNFNNSISTASIIADSIDSKAIASLNIHALLGGIGEDGSITLSNVYYSSDISLFPEELCENATNISANVLTHATSTSTSWQQTLVANGSWQALENGLPYIKLLSEKLTLYKVLSKNSFGAIIEYARGSSLNPIVITASDLQSGNGITGFNYYILGESTNSNDIYSSTLAFNGVLIAGECEYVFTPNSGDVGGIIKSIGKHSAVSNLHVKVADNSAVTLGDEGIGIIAGTNNGVMFNCSVNGANLSVTVNGAAGIIAGVNNGLISYSFSSAEITSLEADNFAGIAWSNFGKILSSYFTGYIGNTSSTAAAGIAGEIGDNSYIYNCYMAGVVKTIANNAFAYGSLEGKGSNNYIDINVNKEELKITTPGVLADEEINLQTIDTQYLMANNQGEQAVLAGNWFNAAEKVDEQYYINLNAVTYGYNYLYPIYNFYKLDSRMDVVRTNYSLYTGTGANDYVVHTDKNLAENNYQDTIVKLIGEEADRSLYKHAMKVPHLGVLKAIQGIAKTVVDADFRPITTNFNYILIYDIDGRYTSVVDGVSSMVDYKWTAVGDSTAQANQFYRTNATFNGLFISNKNYNFTPADEKDVLYNLCTIKNLSGQGLFTNIENAYFGYVQLGSMSDLTNSGALGVEVKNGGDVLVENVYYQNQATFGATNGSYASAMFGLVNSTNSTITIRNSGFTAGSSNYLTVAGAESAGMIVGRMMGGTINFEGGNNLRVAFANSVNYAGGLVGEMINGTINGNSTRDSAITIVDKTDQVVAIGSKIGGLVGRVSKAEVTEGIKNTVSNFIVYFSSTITCSGLGGLIYEVRNSTITFNDCQVMMESGSSFSPTFINNAGGDNTAYFGTICGNLVVEEGNTGAVNAYGITLANNLVVDIKPKNVTFANTDDITDTSQGFGGLVGHMQGGTLSVSSKNEINLTLKARATNVGGLVGCLESGALALENSIAYNIKLYGYNNVGGAFGLCSADLSSVIANFVDADNKEVQSWNFLQAEDQFAEIISFENLDTAVATVNMYNWGGLFGNFTGTGLTNVENHNPITIHPINVSQTYYNSGSSNPNIYNVGGVAGKINAELMSGNLSGLNNMADITAGERQNTTTGGTYGARALSEDATGYDIFELSVGSYDIDGGKYYFAPRLMNVGGVFGNAQNAQIIGLSNNGEIMGYQNVGGLVGYANGSTFTASEGQANSASGSVIGVANVGGALGMMEDSTLLANALANVYGNYNVGGAVGYMHSGTLRNSLVGLEDDGQIEIKGIYLRTLNYLNIPAGTTAKEGQYNRAANFFPTNVGGLIGATSINDTATVEISGNSIKNVLVTSSQEGAINEYEKAGETITDTMVKSFNTTHTISTVNNAFLYNGTLTNGNPDYSVASAPDLRRLITIPAEEDFAKNNEGSISASNLVIFNDMITGFGGFIGSTDAYAVLENISSNNMENVSVYAMLGINTGAIFGTYRANTIKTYTNEEGGSSVSHAIETPTIKSSLYVEGAYNVGGIAGYLYNNGLDADTIKFETEISAGYVHTSGNPTIYVQDHVGGVSTGSTAGSEDGLDALTGMYVGGLFGKLKGDANGLKIYRPTGKTSLKISINSADSYYVGGLIGRLEGNLGGEETQLNSNIVDGAGLSFTSATDKPLVVLGDDKENFGGLIGMLKVEEKSGGTTACAIGWQPFAFTVNTIENSNYYDGETQYSVDNQTDPFKVNLVAQAYYANQDTFNISYSRGGAAQPGSNLPNYNRSTWFNDSANNPLNSLAHGWSKDYTLFKSIQRNAPAGVGEKKSGTNEWDAISPIYDASNITAVGTIGNMFNEDEQDNEILVGYGTADKHETKKIADMDKEYICFTVYDDGVVEPSPKLYSRIGIATPYLNPDQDANGNRDSQKYIKPKNKEGNFWKGLGNVLSNMFAGGAGEQDNMNYINLNATSNQTKALIYLNWVKSDYDTLYDGYRVGLRNTDKVTGTNYNSVAYYVDNYLYSGDPESDYEYVKDDSDKDKVVDKYGLYFVFGILYDNKTLNDKGITEITEETLPKDGSILNVSGMITSNVKSYWETMVKDGLKVALGIIVILIDVAITIGTFGSGSFITAIKSGLKVAIKAIKKVVTRAILIAMVGAVFLSQGWGKKGAEKAMFERTDMSMGFMHGTYTRQINYTDGKLNTNVDGAITWGDAQYWPYSSVRPNDFYNEYYFYVGGDAGGENSLGSTLSKEQGDKILSKKTTAQDGLGYYYENVTIDGSECTVWPKYVYKDGTYYVNAFAADISYTRASNGTRFTAADSGYYQYNDYLNSETGDIYVRGAFNGNTYVFEDKFGDNRLKYEPDGSISVNGVAWADIAQNYGLSPTGYIETHSSEFVYVGDEFDGETYAKKVCYYGYGYMKNAYYTANGTQNINGADKKVGLFTYAGYEGEYEPKGTPGVDYITRGYTYTTPQIVTDPDGSTHTEMKPVPGPTLYYTFAGIAEGSGVDYSLPDYDGGNKQTPDITIGESISINLYPKAFTNPYATENYTDKNIDWTRLQDANYYVNKDFINSLDAEISDQGISHNITYYFYEGGYNSKGVFNSNVHDTFYSEFYHVYNGNVDEGDELGISIEDLVNIPIYDINGELVTDNGNQYRLDKAIELGTLNPETYYIVNKKELDLGDDENINEFMKQYAVENVYIYIPDENGTVGYSIIYKQSANYLIKDGLLSSYHQNFDNDYNYNVGKYLINTEYGIYTRYFYKNDDDNIFTTGTDDFYVLVNGENKKYQYYLYKENMETEPNDIKATYLTESVCVTLGGGSTYTYVNGGVKSTPTGYINVK